MNCEHLKCSCGGTIAMFNRKDFVCDMCGTEFPLHKCDYDVLKINDKTGWIFPMKIKGGVK